MPLVLTLLCRNTYTTDDLHRRISLLHTSLEEVLYVETSSESSNVFERGIAHAQTLGTSEDVAALTQWGEEVWGAFNERTLSDSMQKLKALVEHVPVFVLYLPVAFDNVSLAVLGEWCRDYVHENVLLEVHIDPAVVGGCAFVAKDTTYHDASFTSLLRTHSGLITTLLSSYA